MFAPLAQANNGNDAIQARLYRSSRSDEFAQKSSSSNMLHDSVDFFACRLSPGPPAEQAPSAGANQVQPYHSGPEVEV